MLNSPGSPKIYSFEISLASAKSPNNINKEVIPVKNRKARRKLSLLKKFNCRIKVRMADRWKKIKIKYTTATGIENLPIKLSTSPILIILSLSIKKNVFVNTSPAIEIEHKTKVVLLLIFNSRFIFLCSFI
jgi:hypothetical protein